MGPYSASSLQFLRHTLDEQRKKGILAGMVAGFLILSGCGGLQVNSSSTAVVPSTTDVVFGTAQIGQSVSSNVSISNASTQAIQVAQLNVSGAPFSIASQTPLSFTITPGATVTLALGFDPTAVGDADGELSIVGAASSATPLAQIHLHGTGAAILKAISCAEGSMTGAGTDACTVALNYPAQNDLAVALTSNDVSVAVPQSVTVPSGSASAGFTARIAAVATAQNSIISASTSSQTVTIPIQLNAAIPSLSVSSPSIDFGSVAQGQVATQTVTLSSVGTLPVTISSMSISSSSFSSSGVSTPLTLNPGQTASINLVFTAPSAGSYTAVLAFVSNASSGNPSVNLTATSVANVGLKSLSCGSGSMTGAGTDACSVTLTGPAPAGGFSVSLNSNNPAVTVPSSVAIPAGSASASFTATAAAVTSTQTAILSASTAGSTTETASLQLNATVPTLIASSPTVNFGSVGIGKTVSQSVTLSSTGSAPVTISGIAISGSLFSATGVTTPVTLNPNQTATLTVQFSSSQAGTYAGTLTVASNSSQGNLVVNMSATTTATEQVSALSCASGSITGAGTDACTVTLTMAAPSGGLSINLASNSSAVSVPSSVTVPANASSAAFTAAAGSVASAQTVTLTATAGGGSATFSIQLSPPAQATLSVNATSISFGNVVVHDTATQSITLSSTGTGAVTVSSATVTGAGFAFSGPSFPLTLSAGQAATLNVQFDPSAAGAATGQLTIASNSSTGATTKVSLSGTGESSEEVQLSWNAPISPTDPIAGYRVYRASAGSSSYQKVNSTLDTQTSYTDAAIQSGAAYQYYVTAVDSGGVESLPSNTASVTIP